MEKSADLNLKCRNWRPSPFPQGYFLHLSFFTAALLLGAFIRHSPSIHSAFVCSQPTPILLSCDLSQPWFSMVMWERLRSNYLWVESGWEDAHFFQILPNISIISPASVLTAAIPSRYTGGPLSCCCCFEKNQEFLDCCNITMIWCQVLRRHIQMQNV